MIDPKNVWTEGTTTRGLTWPAVDLITRLLVCLLACLLAFCLLLACFLPSCWFKWLSAFHPAGLPANRRQSCSAAPGRGGGDLRRPAFQLYRVVSADNTIRL